MENTVLAEAVLLPGSSLLGRTLRRERFRESYGAQVLGINHQGTNVIRKLRDVPLRLGDVLLLQGSPENLNRLQESGIVRIVGTSEAMEDVRPRMGRAPLAIAIFLAVLALVTARVLSLPLAVMLGALLVFVTRCITPEEAYARVEWKAIILIGSLLGLGAAMEHTGAAKYLAWQLVSLTGTEPTAAAADRFFCTHGIPYPTDVQSGCGHRHSPDRHPDCASPQHESTHLRHDGRDCRKLLLPYSTRACLPHGLWPGPLPLR